MSAEEYTIDEIQVAAGYIATLADIALEYVGGVPRDKPMLRSEIDKVEALLWAVHGCSKRIDRGIEENYASLNPKPSEVAA